jgi:hypothetical protein
MYGKKGRRVGSETVPGPGLILVYMLWPLVLALAIALMVAAIYLYE